jgi:glycerophosphoryl diester phosphodiesterase
VRLAGRSARFDTRFLQLGIHPGGGHTWMLQRAVGPQGTAAMVLFGEMLDGEAAVAHGLAWRCVPDESLVDEAVTLARRAAAVPRELLRRTKETLRDVAALSEHGEAVERELVTQLWSMDQPAFAERLAALQKRINRSAAAQAQDYEPIVPTPGHPIVVAHRGSSGTLPENTMAAFELAIAQGAQIIEIDVHLTADDELVVIHDDTLERTTDAAERLAGGAPWNVHEHTLDEIRSLSAGPGADGRPQQVPTLAEVIDLVRRHDVGLLIETKTLYTGDRLERAIGRLLGRYDDASAWMRGRLMIGSFDWDSLLRARAELPGVNLALIVGWLAARDGIITHSGPIEGGVTAPGTPLVQLRDRLSGEGIGYLGTMVLGMEGEIANQFDAETVDWFRAGGVEINFITDEPEVMRSYVDRGVSSILTNHPARLVDVLAQPAEH